MNYVAELGADEMLYGFGVALVTGLVAAVVGGWYTKKVAGAARRAAELVRCFDDFEKAASAFHKLIARYGSYLSPPAYGRGTAEFEQVMAKAWDEIGNSLGTDINEALHILHQVEGRLHVTGSVAASKLAESYRVAATDLQSAIVIPIQNRTRPSPKEWAERGAELIELRKRFCNQLREDIQQL